jgi:hypothetical protein
MFGKAVTVVKPLNFTYISSSQRTYNNFQDKIASERPHGVNAAYRGALKAELFGALIVVNNLLITIFVGTCKKT